WFFFFKGEEGIGDWSVTGVQTCALPISVVQRRAANGVLHRVNVPAREHSPDAERRWRHVAALLGAELASEPVGLQGRQRDETPRSEERRVGKECESRRAAGG